MKRVFAHIGFAFAVSLLVINLVPANYILIITAGLAVIFIASLLLPKYRQALTFPICIGSALFACFIFLIIYNGSVIPQRELNFKSADASFYIVDVSEKSDDGYIYTVKTKEIDRDGAPQDIKLRLKSSDKINAQPYQIVNANLTFYTIGDNAVNSYGWWSEGIYLSANADKLSTTDKMVNSPWHYILDARIDIINTLYDLIGGDAGALASALLTGYRSLLSSEAYNNFKLAGSTHLMAVSGLHLTVITGAFLFILKKLHINDKANAVITLFSVLVYIGIAGFSKSVIRAGIMMAVMLIGRLFGRRGDSLNALGLAVFIICLNPFAVYDVGAMLSVLSVLSLITLYPILIKCIDKNAVNETDGLITVTYSKKIVVRIVSGFLVALGVMIYTLPVIYLYYGSVNLVSLISNIILVPMGSAAMVLCLIAYIFAKLHFPFAAYAAGFWNKLILVVVKLFASLKHSAVAFGQYFGLVIAGVLIIFAFCFILKNKRLLRTAAVISSIMIIGYALISNIYYIDKAQVLITENSSAVITYRGKTIVYGIDNKSDYYSVYNYLFSNRYDIDTIIIGADDEYSLLLLENINCNTVVSYSFDDKLLQQARCSEVNICNEFEYDFTDDFSVKFKINSDGKYFVSKIFDATLFISNDFVSNCDIIVCNDNIKDNIGSIDLSDGDIVYIMSDNYIAPRRVDAWRK